MRLYTCDPLYRPQLSPLINGEVGRRRVRREFIASGVFRSSAGFQRDALLLHCLQSTVTALHLYPATPVECFPDALATPIDVRASRETTTLAGEIFSRREKVNSRRAEADHVEQKLLATIYSSSDLCSPVRSDFHRRGVAIVRNSSRIPTLFSAEIPLSPFLISPKAISRSGFFN